MPRFLTHPAALLLAVASMLALLVGLVGSGGRPTSRPRWIASAEPRAPERASVVLRTPVLAPQEVESPAAPVQTKSGPTASKPTRAKLTGIVLRPEGEPAAGARVLLGQQQARCDAEGRFELTLAPERSGTDLLAFEPGHEPALRPAFGLGLGAGGEHSVRLVLGPQTLTLDGTVSDANGEPLEGWIVELDELDLLADFGLREPVCTDGEGRFVISDVCAGVHVLRAWRERRELAFHSAPAAAGESGIAIVVVE